MKPVGLSNNSINIYLVLTDILASNLTASYLMKVYSSKI